VNWQDGFLKGAAHCAGDEFYLKEWPQVEGYSFREVLISFPKATPIGVKEHATQSVVLNPEDTYIIQPGGHFPPHSVLLPCVSTETRCMLLFCVKQSS